MRYGLSALICFLPGRICVVLAVWTVLAAADAYGQLRLHDFTTRENRLSPQRYEPHVRQPQRNERFLRQQQPLQITELGRARLDRKPMSHLGSRRFEAQVRTFPVGQPALLELGRSRLDGQRARLGTDQPPRSLDIGENPRFESASVATLHELQPGGEVPRGIDEMSLRDLNRFQFRRNRSSEPGIPIQRAGSGTGEALRGPEATQPQRP